MATDFFLFSLVLLVTYPGKMIFKKIIKINSVNNVDKASLAIYCLTLVMAYS